MVHGTQEQAGVASNGVAGYHTGKSKNRNGNGLRFAYCPRCNKKGLYKVAHWYERCRCCGLHRVLLPGQDF
jgi:hypothetical protein